MVIKPRQRTGLIAVVPVRLIFFLAMICISAPLTAAELGRLFFTPAERAQLDLLRDSGGQASQLKQNESTAPLQTISLDGVLQRKGGTVHSWVNGASSQAGILLPVKLGRQIDSNRALAMELPDGTQIRPKTGQWFDLMQGTLYENYERQPAPQETAVSIGQD